MNRFHVLVIGAGTAGSHAASTARKYADLVGVVEKGMVGGDCIYHACIPTKALVYAARAHKKMRTADFFGLPGAERIPDYRKVKAFKDRIVERLGKGQDEALTKRGVKLFRGQARFTGRHEVVIDGEPIVADRIIIATGAPPAVPLIPGLREAGYLTNIEALQLEQVPARLAIIGGGAVGAEFANIFSSFGSRVYLYEATDRILPAEDEDVSDAIKDLFVKQGIYGITSARITQVSRSGSGRVLSVADSSGQVHVEEVDEILVATGRKPGTEGLNLEAVGVNTTSRGIAVDSSLRTNMLHVYAAGDVTGEYKYVLTAREQGRVAGWNATHDEQRHLNYDILPRVTYCDPEVASVGLTETQARQRGIRVKIGRYDIARLGSAIVTGETDGFIKVVADADSGQILGGHVLSAEASTLIHEIALAMSGKLTAADVSSTFHAYPTFSEGIRYACHAVA